MSLPAKPFTQKQGQYLAFIYAYTQLNRRPPAEIDMQRYFQVSPPSVHQMVLTLEREGANQGSLAASKCSLIRNPSRSYASRNSIGQNHCAALLGASAGKGSVAPRPPCG